MVLGLKNYFKGLGSRAVKYVNWKAYAKELAKPNTSTEKQAAINAKVLVTAKAISDAETKLLIKITFNHIVEAQQAGAMAAEADAGAASDLAATDLSTTIEKAARDHVDKLIKGLNDTTIGKIQNSIADSLAQGNTVQQAQDALSDLVNDPDRAHLIATTESVNAYGQGTLTYGIQSGATTKTWETQYDPCPICEDNADDGDIDINDSFSSGDDAPSAHPNAILGGQEVKALGVSAKMIADYNGLAVYLTTRSNIRIAVTPKHPMATPNGWVQASKLKKGDYLFSAPNWIERMSLDIIDPDSKPVISLIEDVSIPGNVVLRSVPASPIDLHGDGVSCKNIDIIFADSKLGITVNGELFKRTYNNKLSRRGIALSKFNPFSSFNKTILALLTSLYRSMGCFRVSFIKLWRSFTHHQSIGDNLVSDCDSRLLKSISDDLTTTPQAFSDLIDGFPSDISLDEIVSVEIKPFHGFVYDLSTEYQFYTCNSILVHNCRCRLVVNYPDGSQDDSEDDSGD